MIQTVTAYRTTDGKTFIDKNEAEQHQASLLNIEKLHIEVTDLLNKLVLKLKNIPRAEVQSDDNGCYYITNLPVDNDKLKMLGSVKDYCLNVLESDYRATQYTTHYYDSSCY